jgi:hypothetical protein
MTKNEKQERFIKDLFDNCKTHDEFISVGRFGITSLLQDKHLFIHVLVQQAFNESEEKSPQDIAFSLSHIFNDLQLGFKED